MYSDKLGRIVKGCFLSMTFVVVATTACAREKLPYQNAKLKISQRVADLLQRMTLEEKVGQLRCTLAWNYYQIEGSHVVPSESFKQDIANGNIGMLWATYRADPWTQKSLENGLNPVLAAEAGNALQKYVKEHTRLGIPLFLAEEAPHGHMAIGTTVFPTGLGMAATWDPVLAEEVGRVEARQIRLQGAQISYGPVLDLSRDPRWSRVEESMGEDPVLMGTLGAALCRGLSGEDISKPDATLATLKHFIGYGTTEGGQNGGQSVITQRDLLQNFLPPFKQAIAGGALSVMTSYNSLDGIPSTSNKSLLTDLLRDEWKFRGFVVSDLYSIDGIYGTHRTVASLEDAAIAAIKAGVDVDLGGKAYATLVDAVKAGKLDEAVVDSACARVLAMKFEMGLFDHPYVDPKKAKMVNDAADKAVALKAAQASVTLLKNDNQLLPLSKEMNVAVIGPNADNVYNLLGDYTAPQADGNVKTLLMGIQSKVKRSNIRYAKGCAIRDTTATDLATAVEAAKASDVVIVAVGGSSARDFKTSYKETGAAETDAASLSDMDSGEGFDRSTLGLLGDQMRLLKALKATGKPMVVVYIEGRPLEMNWAKDHADALLTAYYPGQEGGQAIADVLFGDVNPAGRLPISIPTSTGMLPDYYNHRPPVPHDYVEMSAKPAFCFGYGLSYTTFQYSNLQIERTASNTYRVSFDITNTGERDGDEVAQLYIHDEVASVAQPVMQLKHFQRVSVPKGSTQHICFQLQPDDFKFIGEDMKWTLEPGTVDIMIGSSSDHILLKDKINLEQ